MSSTAEPAFPGMLPPPPGVTPNLANPGSMGWRLVVASVLCPFFAVLLWVLRLYTSRRIVHKFWPDDWLIMVSVVFTVALSAVDIAQTRYGLGAHMWDVSPTDFQRIIIVGIPASVFYNLSTLFVKASILLFYVRFASANRPFRIAVYALIAVVALYSLNAGFNFLYLCSPVRRLWDFSVPGTCVDIYTTFLASSIINAITDVIILLLPIWLLYPLRWRLARKLAVGAALIPGGFVCAVSIYRVVSIPDGVDDPDTTWRYCINNVWCLVELNAGIMCACLPSLKPFAKHHLPGLFPTASPASPARPRVDFGAHSARHARMHAARGHIAGTKDDDEGASASRETDLEDAAPAELGPDSRGAAAELSEKA